MTHATTDTMEPVSNTIAEFGQFGLAGLVILALFYTVHKFIEKLDAINEMHNERHDKRNELHAAERKEWLQVTKENLEVNKENTALIKTLSAQLNGSHK